MALKSVHVKFVPARQILLIIKFHSVLKQAESENIKSNNPLGLSNVLNIAWLFFDYSHK